MLQICSPAVTSADTDRVKSVDITTFGSSRSASSRSNIYVQPGPALHNEPSLPPRTSAAAHNPTSFPVTLSAPRREQYSDYRNDYYIKQEQKKSDEDKDKSVPVSDSSVTDLLTSTVEVTDELHDSNLKCMKNTPPLPRKKKKRHRQGFNLCCFTADQDHSSDEPV